MKKEYVKPYLALESFQLVAALAGACAMKVEMNISVDECLPIDQTVAFFGTACVNEGLDHYTFIDCYHGPSGSSVYVNS